MHAGFSRRGSGVALVVLHSDPRPQHEALTDYAQRRAATRPHYYMAHDGSLTPLVSEGRATRHSGTARWRGKRRNIDRISIGITLEHIPGTAVRRAQLIGLHILTAQLRERHGLGDDALFRWEQPYGVAGDGALLVVVLPPDPAVSPYDPTPRLLPEIEYALDSALVLSGDEVQQQMWAALAQESFARRGEGLQPTWAFHQQADARKLGAPLARSAGSDKQVVVGGTPYGYQPFARDTLFNEGNRWNEVCSLNELLGGTIPSDPNSLGYKLLEAAFLASGAALFPYYAFHQVAVREQLGYPLGNSYRAELAGQQYSLQVFSCDTLYTPLANPESNTNWGDVRRLSQTEDPALAQALWAETYRPCGAAYDVNGPFQQFAAQARDLGAPLSGVYEVTINETVYQVQIFAADTLHATPGGAVQRMRDIPHDVATTPATTSAVQASATTTSAQLVVGPGILPVSGVESAWLAANPQAPLLVKQLLVQSLCLLGYENTVFDALPPSLQALTWGGDPSNRAPGGQYYKDICCADLVTLCLAATGINYRWAGWGGTNNTRLAAYYQPCEHNADVMRRVGNNEPFLPGDILTWSTGNPNADHVFMYVGPVRGSLPAIGTVYNDTYNCIEASINEPVVPLKIYAYNQPINHMGYYQNNGAWFARGRLHQLEAAYRETGMV